MEHSPESEPRYQYLVQPAAPFLLIAEESLLPPAVGIVSAETATTLSLASSSQRNRDGLPIGGSTSVDRSFRPPLCDAMQV
mmetsp:Transcript_43763/g.107445  ORF Transcript_43763/g.107445 Transcript_43763/m.107445 type:complete len:81 (+) Transcript_43763:121-363(+)